jgi:hypothetical protein
VLPQFGDKKPFAYLQTRFAELFAKFSPDGRWVAYTSDESGRPEIYVAPFPTPSGKWQISTVGGSVPRWRNDGKEIFYIAPDDKLMVAAVNAQGPIFQPGAVQPLFQTRAPTLTRYPYVVSSDGQHFLVNTIAGEATSSPVTLVVNWPAVLKK